MRKFLTFLLLCSLTMVAQAADDTVGSNGGDYLTPEIMGFDLTSSSSQTIAYGGAPSGATYNAICSYINSETSEFYGDFSISSTSGKSFIWNSTSAGTLSKFIIVGDENEGSSAKVCVRASNEAFDGSSFSAFSSYGTLVGEIYCSVGGTVEFSGDYAYFAIGHENSWDSASRFKAIEVVWSTDGGGGGSGSTELPDGYTVVPAEGEVESLSVITLDTEGGLGESSNFYDETKKAAFKVTNDATGETVATLKEWEIMLDETTWHAWAEIRLSNDVTAAGSYTVYIPEGAFLDATDYNYDANPAIELHYTVTGSGSSEGGSEGGSGSHEYSFAPAEGTVSSLQNFTLTCNTGFCADENGGTEYSGSVSIYKDGSVYATTSDIDSDWEPEISFDFDVYLYINFAEAIVEAGDYELVIPAGLFYWMDGEDLGALNEEMRFSYTVDGSADTGGSEGGSEGGSVGSNGGDYITAENIGLTAGATSNETVTFTGPSGTVYEANARWVSGGDYDGTINFFATGYLKNTSSVGTLSKLIFEDDGNDTGSSVVFYVRAANEPWDGSDFTSYGTEVAQVTVAAGGEFAIDGEYTYFACYGGGALTAYRFKSVEVVWSTGDDDDEGGEEESAIPAGYVLDPAHESYVETLSTIVISLASGSNLTLDTNGYNTEGVVMSKTGGQVGTVSFSDDYDDELQLGWCVATLSEPISDMGTYYVTFPAGVFYDWGEYESNPEFTAIYYVTGSGDTGEYSFDPADGSTLSSLESFDVAYSTGINCAWDQTLLISVTDENGNFVAYDDDCVDNWPDDWDWGDPCPSCTITLNTKIVAAGTYTISIPAGYFVVGENDLLSEALTVSYTVDGSEDTGSEGGDEGGVEDGLSSISSVLENAAGIYSVDGQLRTTLTKGVNIVKMNDGSTKKVFMK